MTPNDKLKVAGYIAGQIGYHTYGYGETEAAALADLAYESDAKLPAYPASKEAIALADADTLTPDWHIIEGTIYSKMAGCNWVIESIASGALGIQQIRDLACEYFITPDVFVFEDGTIGMNSADRGMFYTTTEFAIWAANPSA